MQDSPVWHILASPGYAHGTIAVNVTWILVAHACQTHRSMYSSIFNRFPVIQPVSSKVRHFLSAMYLVNKVVCILAHFCTFWPPLGTPLGQSW